MKITGKVNVNATLSPREEEWLIHHLNGASQDEIAEAMGVEWNSVPRYANSVRKKVGAGSKSDLRLFAIATGRNK